MNDSKKIFLTGLPRMKSAWLSNLLTWGDSFILHDGFDGCETFTDFKEKLNLPHRVVGNSDPANVLFWKQIVAEWPDATWIVIRRGIHEVWKSLQPLVGKTVELKTLVKHDEMLEELTNHVHAEVFNFHTLDKDDCRHIAKLCDVQLDERRLDMLWNLNIQIDPKHLKRRIAEMSVNPPQILKDAVYV